MLWLSYLLYFALFSCELVRLPLFPDGMACFSCLLLLLTLSFCTYELKFASFCFGINQELPDGRCRRDCAWRKGQLQVTSQPVNQQMKMPSYVILLSIDGIDGCPPFLFQASFSIAIPTYSLSMFSFCLLSLFSSCRSTRWPLKFAWRSAFKLPPPPTPRTRPSKPRVLPFWKPSRNDSKDAWERGQQSCLLTRYQSGLLLARLAN